MGGVMPDRHRDAAIKRLRRAAHRAMKARRHRGLSADPTPTNNWAFRDLDNAWREFPECERDDSTPSPEAALEMCESYDRQKAEAERIAARAAGGV